MITRASQLPPVPDRAVKAYEARSELMAALVFQSLVADKGLFTLHRGDGLDVLEGHYRHHTQLMASAFRLNSWELLVRTLPWMYRVAWVRGLDLDHCLKQMRMWRKVVEACLNPALSAPILAAYDWILSEHPTLVELCTRPESFLFSPRGTPGELEGRFMNLLLQGKAWESLGLAEREADTPEKLERFYVDVLQSALRRVGVLWERGAISVGEEHVATATANAVAASLYSRVARPRRARGLAVVACAPHENHEIGARLVTDCLEMAGWETLNLGANVPTEHLILLLCRLQPFLLALSVGTTFSLGQSQKVIEAVRACPELAQVRIMAGGNALTIMNELCHRLNAHGTAPDGPSAARLAEAWWREGPL